MIRFLSAIIVVLLTGHISLASENHRQTYNFNYGWKLSVGDPGNAQQPDFDDSSWQAISLPHAWNEDEAFKLDIHDLSNGICWYRKHFALPENCGAMVFLEFEGVRQAAEVYLNGTWIGRHENGAMAFGLDISNAVQRGPDSDNIIAVHTDSSWDYREKSSNSRYQWSDKNFNANYGGIPKNVKLHCSGKLYQTLPLYSNLGTTGTYIYANQFDITGKTARINAESQVCNASDKIVKFKYLVSLESLDGDTLKTFTSKTVTVLPGETTNVKASSPVSNLEFWSWGYGYLYNVKTSLIVNGKAVDTVCTQTGFRKTAFNSGMFYLNDRVLQLKGYAQRTSNEWPAVGMSVPPWLSDFSNRLITESNGNLVRWMHITPWKQDVESCDRVGLIQAMPAGDSEKDVSDRRWGQRCELMRDAIIYNRNNPSIIFYEGGNENISEEHMAELKSIRDTYDPYGGRAIGSREMLDSKIAEYGGEMLYINKSSGKPVWAMEYSRDEGLRRYQDEFTWPYHKDSPAYNRNQDSHAIENIIRWFDYWQCRPGTGKRVSSGGVNIVFSDTNTHFRGDENYRRSGEVDAMRIPKDGFFVHQVMWDGWVDTEKYGIYIFGHWNYKSDTVKDISACSTAEKVELFINGKSQGFGQRSYDFLFTFNNIVFEPGEITAIGYDNEDNVLCRTERKTAREPAAIKLRAITSPEGFTADGADLALIEVEVVDANGLRCPTAFNEISFELTGPAQWRGGIAQGPGNYILSKTLPVELGVNRILVRSLTTGGKITVKATAEDLRPAEITLISEPVTVSGGLSEYLPAAQLPVNLNRGPTPTGNSFTTKRTPIKIVSAIAGANNSKTTLSYDDNEMTNWDNHNEKENGWISYQFDKRHTVSQVVAKFSGWRTRSYPIRIMVDDKEVFKGDSPKSLGYVTFDFKPTTGRTVSIELIGANKDEDAFDLVEVTGKKDEQGQISQTTKGNLSIVEIEIY